MISPSRGTRRHAVTSFQRAATVLVLLAAAAHHAGRAGATEAPARSEAAARPNIVIFLADDLGYGDLGCYGHPTIRTPHLDRLAAEGMRFTEFYSAAEVCTPSRAALLTGRYPIRSGMCHDRFRVLRNNSAGGLPDGELTLAEALRAQGYATACVGKWHLGHLPRHLPMKHGFDGYFGMPYSNDMQPAPDAPAGREKFFAERTEFWRTPLIRGAEVVDAQPDQRRLTALYVDEATKFIRAQGRRPFFLYFAHNFPHVPLFASREFRGKSPAGRYGDVVEELDWGIGQIVAALRATGVEKNTLVFFTSDNGPWLVFDQHGGSAGPLRDGKGSTWEGGMRVPGIAWWPGRIAAGTVQRQMATTMDLFPTCVRLAGGTTPSDRPLDGIDIGPLFAGAEVARGLFAYYRGSTLYAARLGPWKAHFITQPAYGAAAPAKHDPPRLYHLGEDPGERFDVAAKQPEVVARIVAAVAEHRRATPAAASQLVETVRP